MHDPDSTDGPTGSVGTRMVFPKARAVVGGVLFLAWLGFLGYLVWQTRQPVILSRPQILSANLIILADLEEVEGRPGVQAKVRQVLAAQKPEWKGLAGQTLEIDDLPFMSPSQGWKKAGTYLIPVTRREQGKLIIDQVTLLPIVPGYYPATTELTVSVGKNATEMAKVLAEATGVSVSRLQEMLAAPVVVLVNVPVRFQEELNDLRQRIQSAGGNLERSRPAEARIYSATSETLDALTIIRPAD